MIDPPPEILSRRLGRIGWFWLAGMAVLGALTFLLGWLDDTTELTPDHPAIDQASLWVGLSGGLATAAILIWQAARFGWAQRIGSSLALGFGGAMVSFMFFSFAAHLIENRLDFPPEKVRTYRALLLIDRAYEMTGKGRSWHIQTTPLWSDFDISEQDYDFMLAHRVPTDTGHDPTEIRGDGLFCARVTVEFSGTALRVLHAGNHTLPEGTIAPCPIGVLLVNQAAAPPDPRYDPEVRLRPLGGGLYVLS